MTLTQTPTGRAAVNRLLSLFFATVAAFGLVGCQPNPIPPVETPRVAFERPPPAPDFTESTPDPVRTTRITPGPGGRVAPMPRAPAQAAIPGGPSGAPIAASFDQMPLPAFINTVFGELLKVNYQMDPSVASRQDVVTLRTGGARTPQELLAVATEVLSSYGLQVMRTDNIYRIVPSDVMMQQIPDVIRSRALPDVPVDLRPIFQYFQLQEAKVADVVSAIANIVGSKVKLQPIPQTNAVIIFGLPQDMQTVSRMIATLDRASFGNNLSIRIDPVYWNAQPLAQRLLEIMRAQGYNASIGGQQSDTPISIIPVAQVNSVLVFAPTQQVLDFISAWAQQLDQPSGSEDNQRVFLYFVRNTKAGGIADVVSAAIEGSQSGSRQGSANSQAQQSSSSPSLAGGSAATPGSSGLGQSATTSTSGTGSSTPGARSAGRLVVDEVRNALVFSGSAAEWARYRPLIEQLDVPTREALIEVTVLEVALTDNTSLGIQGLFSGSVDGHPFTIGSLVTGANGAVTDPGQSANGLNIRVFNSAGVLRGALTALATNNRVNVVSNPRLLARSGAEAKILIGDDVPTVTSQGQSTVGSSTVLQSVQYRQTGVVLTVKPIIHAGQRVDLEVSQEVSDVNTTAQVAGISSPTISSRKVTTQLALLDGATVILGGMIKENRTIGDEGIPVLKDIPIIGQAFRSNKDNRTRTELIVLITPYIITGPDDIKAITNAYTEHLQQFSRDNDINMPLLPRYYSKP
ncbi:MAG: hypothetical protein F9K30_21775 [Dechloromonas sp.]|nr:MAG: hypothetical protein F9K30_21775 [Dechloromonas sp.]